MYSSYPRELVWRVDLTLLMGAILVTWLLLPRAGAKRVGALLFFVIYPVVAFVLLSGMESIGLPKVSTDLWGGVFVSLLVSAVGIVFSLPGGVLLALGRRSRLPMVRMASVIFIEFVRGVPLITVLFMANFMLPLFVPENWTPDRLLRPLIGVSLFASAYMAEVVRGGLQAMPKGQFEGAMALGLGYGRMMRLVVLPQALTKVIPGIVNTFIGLFKDTTLVAIVGIYDFLRAVETARLDPNWAGPTISTTGYIFAALFYFVFCFGMSRYSQAMERDLSRDRSR
jgi:general L-amino acid transport system permease protein